MNTALKTGLMLLIALLSGVIGFYAYQSQEQLMSTTAKPSAIAFTLPDLTGKIRRADEWAGKIIVLNFWATWCAPCKKEIPEFIELQQHYRDKNVQFIGIATLDETEKVRAFSKAANINYPILLGNMESIKLSKQLGNRFNALPFTVVADAQGQISDIAMGELPKEKAIQMLEKLLR